MADSNDYQQPGILPGPVTGFPMIWSFGPSDAGAQSRRFLATVRLPFRPMCVGWSYTSTDHTTVTIQASFRDQYTGAAGNNLISAFAIDGDAAGVIYFNDANGDEELVSSTGSGLSALGDGTGTDDIDGREFVPTINVDLDHPCIMRLFVQTTTGGASLLGFNGYIMGFPVGHVQDEITATGALQTYPEND